MEGYILGGLNICESEFKEKFKKVYGEKILRKFEESFRSNFIKESDFKRIKEWGANSVRIPFNYRILKSNKRPFRYKREGIELIEKILNYAKNIKFILF